MSAKLIGWALHMPNLTQPEKMVLLVLADRSKDGVGLSWYTQATIAKLASCSRKTANLALASLSEKRLIIRQEWFTTSGARTSDRIFLQAPGCNAGLQGGVTQGYTIPSTPNGVKREKKEGAWQGGALRIVGGSSL